MDTNMEDFKADDLFKKLRVATQEFQITLAASSKIDKYPAKQHARATSTALEAEDGLIYLPGEPTRFLEDSDQFSPFRQRRYFYYLSGVDEPDCHVVYDISKDIVTLFIPEYTDRQVVWNGRGSTKSEAMDKYDIDQVLYIDDLQPFIRKWMVSGRGGLYILHPDQKPGFVPSSSHCLNSSSLMLAMDFCRSIKDQAEIDAIRRANRISSQAHRRVLEQIHLFTNETEIEGHFIDECVSEGAKHQAYSIIAASGRNGATLHYVKNDEPLEGRQFVVLDAGAEWECYASDVTRTFPRSGSWPSPEAKGIYELVQEMQDSCIALLKPDILFRDVQVLAQYIAAKGLLRLGILHNGTVDEILKAGTTLAFFPHGVGHHVGLEVHDVSSPSTSLLELRGKCRRFKKVRREWGLSGITTDDSSPPAVGSPFQENILVDEEVELEVFKKRYSHLISPGLCRSPVDFSSKGLQQGMIVTVEPGIYFSEYALTKVFLPSPVHSKFINEEVLKRYLSVGGVRIEDDILITHDGHENLTTAPKGEEMLDIIGESERKSRSKQRKELLRQFDSVKHRRSVKFNLMPSSQENPIGSENKTQALNENTGYTVAHPLSDDDITTRSAISANDYDYGFNRPRAQPPFQSANTRLSPMGEISQGRMVKSCLSKRKSMEFPRLSHEYPGREFHRRRSLACLSSATDACMQNPPSNLPKPSCESLWDGLPIRWRTTSSLKVPLSEKVHSLSRSKTTSSPPIPPKTPILPVKPLAYRASMPELKPQHSLSNNTSPLSQRLVPVFDNYGAKGHRIRESRPSEGRLPSQEAQSTQMFGRYLPANRPNNLPEGWW